MNGYIGDLLDPITPLPEIAMTPEIERTYRRIDRLRDTPRPNRLVILMCSRTKSAKGKTEPLPAIEHYNGPLWQTLRAADPTGALAQVAVLSARYGLKDARGVELEPYDEVMTPSRATDMLHGGAGLPWPRNKKGRNRFGCGTTAYQELGGMSDIGKSPFRDVLIVGGHLYVGVGLAWVREVMANTCKHGFIDRASIAADARVTTLNDEIGYMRQGLRRWLLEDRTDD